MGRTSVLFSLKKDTSHVYALADQLEALLDIAENLRQVRFASSPVTAETSAETLLGRLELLRDFASRVAILEFNLAAKLDQARYFARRTGRNDASLRNFAMLFVSGTQAVMDRLPSLADRARSDFLHANETVAFLEERQLFNPLEASLDAINDIRPAEGYLVFGVVALDAIEQLADSFLTAIDSQYGIYIKEDDSSELAASAAPLIASKADAILVASHAPSLVAAAIAPAANNAPVPALATAGATKTLADVSAGAEIAAAETAVEKSSADTPADPNAPIIVEQPRPVRLIDRISRLTS